MKHTLTARTLAAVIGVAALTTATLTVRAQTMPPAGPSAMSGTQVWARMPATDADFVRALNLANTAELNQAKYVVNRTHDATVHQYAQHMIDEHSTAAVQLEAATRGTNLRPAPRDDGRESVLADRVMAMLQGDTGAQLDNDYMRVQVPQHRRVLGLLNWEQQNGGNTNLKALASRLAPSVQQHLQLAQQYLASHNLTPYTPPDVIPVPGNPNPNGAGTGPGPGVPNNPASMPNGGSTGGQNNASGGTQPNTAPVTGPTYQPLGSGTPPPGAGPTTAPSPMPSASPRPS